LGNDVIDQLPGARPYSDIRGEEPDEIDPMGEFGQDDQDEPMGVASDEPEDQDPYEKDLGPSLGVTDCDYCGKIQSVFDDGAGGKGCSRCLRGDYNLNLLPDPDVGWDDAPAPEEPAPEEPDFAPIDRERTHERIGRTKSWKQHRDAQYRPQ
jgi:hypothetical protein